jgi:hypothetical protein
VGAAVLVVGVVGETHLPPLFAVVVLQAHFHRDPVHHLVDVDGRVLDRLAGVQVLDVLGDPLVGAERLPAAVAVVADGDRQPLVQEGDLLQAGGQAVVVERV